MRSSRPPPEPTTTSAFGCQSARVNTALSHRIRRSSLSMAWLIGRLHGALAGMHDERDHRLGFDDAYRGGVVADDLGDAPRQRFGRLRQPDRHDVFETRSDKDSRQQGGLGVGVVAPGHADGVQPVAPGGGDRLGAQHRGGGLLRGLQRTRPPAGADLECFAVHGGAVGFLPFDKHETDGRRCHRQAEYGVHLQPFRTSTYRGDTYPCRRSPLHRALTDSDRR